jgi:hypothetical protein
VSEGCPHEADQQEDEDEGAEEAEEPEAEPVAPAVSIAADVRPDGVRAGRDDDLAALGKTLADPGVVGTDSEEGDAGEDHQRKYQSGDASSVHVVHFSVCVGDRSDRLMGSILGPNCVVGVETRRMFREVRRSGRPRSGRPVIDR